MVPLAQSQVPSQPRLVRVIKAEGRGYQLNRIGGVLVHPSSDLYVVSQDESALLVFDRTGAMVRRFGRKGSGPGEMQTPLGLGLWGDSVWVFDYPLARLTLFGPDGRPGRTVPLTRSGQGSLLDDGNVAVYPPTGYSYDAKRPGILTIQKFSPAGRLLDTLAHLPFAPRALRFVRDGGLVVGEQPFDDFPLVTFIRDGSGLVIVDRKVGQGGGRSPRFRVTVIGVRGDTVYSTVLPYQVLPTGPSRERAIERLTAGPTGARGDADTRARVAEALFVPPYLPTVTAVVPGGGDAIWLRREETYADSVRWTVLGRRGKPVRELYLPARTWPYWVSRDAFWALTPDPDGLPNLSYSELLPRIR